MGTAIISLTDKSDHFTFSIEAKTKSPLGRNVTEVIDDLTFDILILYTKPVLLNPKYSLALISNNPLLVNAGGFSYVNKRHLNIMDFKNEGPTFCYVLRTPPKGGELKLRNNLLKEGSTFSQKDLNANELIYQHHQKNSGNSDFFIFSIVDDKGAMISSDAFPIHIVKDNTAPQFINLCPIPAKPGQETTISHNCLCVTDAEQGPDSLSYQILNLPEHGVLESKTTGVLAKHALFTQSDIDAGLIVYKHFNPKKENDSFTFLVDDSAGGVTEVTTLEITISDETETSNNENRADDANKINEKAAKEEKEATLDTHGMVAVNKKGRSIIPTEELHLFDASMGRATFHSVIIKTFPSAGRLVRSKLLKGHIGKSRSIRAEEPLTKKDFDDGLIAYIHSDISNKKVDAFEAILMDKNQKAVKTRKCCIQIIKDNNAPVIVENHILHIQTGYIMTITNELLKVTDSEQGADELTFSIQIPPMNGTLFKNQEKIQGGGIFTQKDIDDKLINYSHNGESNNSDTVTFSVDDGAGGVRSGILFRVAITKKSFALLQNNPLSLRANESGILQGGNLRIIHTGKALPPLKYVLKTTPEKGDLYVKDTALKAGETFTQENIDAGELRFMHNPAYEKTKK